MPIRGKVILYFDNIRSFAYFRKVYDWQQSCLQNNGFMAFIQKILIVDDKPENLFALESVLKDLGVLVVKAKNGNDALKAILNHDFSLAILDVQMPEMDGYELAEFVRSEEKTTYLPIIFLSAVFSDEFHVFKGYQHGAVDFITKPFNPEILLNKVRVFLQLNQQKMELSRKNERLEKEISERRKIEDALRQNECRLKELNATKDKFFSIVAHDLKNPFNTLIGFSHLLITHADNLDEEKVRSFYEMIHNSARQGFNLLENLLAWSRSQTGRLEWHPIVFDIRQSVNENIKLLGATADRKQIKLDNKISEPLMVYGDLNMLTTVLRNLISNALKFTLSGQRVEIFAREEDQAVICVKDTGIGISEEDQAKLFRIDVNHSTKGTANEQGTGLGLILCKEFIQKNSGHIWVESELGKGSCFCFSLPKSPSHS